MEDAWHDRRLAQLKALQQTDPRAIIDLYCEITGRSEGKLVPYQASFSRMISTIVDFEAQQRKNGAATN